MCPKFIFYLDLLKCRGFEQYSGINTIIDYITGYTCKGGENSVVRGDSINEMLDASIDKDNEDGHLKSLVATIMNAVSKQHSIPRSEFMFTLSGGKLKRQSFEFAMIFQLVR